MDKATNLKAFPVMQWSTPIMKSSFVLILKCRDYEFYTYQLYEIQKNKWHQRLESPVAKHNNELYLKDELDLSHFEGS